MKWKASGKKRTAAEINWHNDWSPQQLLLLLPKLRNTLRSRRRQRDRRVTKLNKKLVSPSTASGSCCRSKASAREPSLWQTDWCQQIQFHSSCARTHNKPLPANSKSSWSPRYASTFAHAHTHAHSLAWTLIVCTLSRKTLLSLNTRSRKPIKLALFKATTTTTTTADSSFGPTSSSFTCRGRAVLSSSSLLLLFSHCICLYVCMRCMSACLHLCM